MSDQISILISMPFRYVDNIFIVVKITTQESLHEIGIEYKTLERIQETTNYPPVN